MTNEEILKKYIETCVKYGGVTKKFKNNINYKNLISKKLFNIILFDHAVAETFAKYLLESGKWKKLHAKEFDFEDTVEEIKEDFLLGLVLTPDEERLNYISKLL